MKVKVPFLDLSATTREVSAAVCESWNAILAGSRFIGGPVVEQFEAAWSSYCGTSEAVGVANGTDAIQLTLRAMGIGAGDEVVLPANTFVATAEAVVLAGATPRFADVDPDTLLLCADTLRPALTSRTKAVIVVHLYGQMADMDALADVTGHHGVALIEDAAQAQGATWAGRRAGSAGHAGCFSFYPGKNLGAFGDAGAVVTSDACLAARVRSLRDHGRVAGSHYEHDAVGTNSRLDAIQAAVLIAKLTRLDEWNDARRRIAARYRAAFGSGVLQMVAEAPAARGVYHVAVARIRDRDRVQRIFTAIGIETAIHYPTPCHLIAPYRRYADAPLPVAEHAAGEVLSLPMYPQMSTEQVERVCAAAEVVNDILLAKEASRHG
ncbi:MAG: DegT/DnrJ/EryC1/StrS family aminotransferase [Pseudonocardiales bacterium]|nr:DegT/DnrJ/EryC1/StrS family aminotransferase [Pseudonocardiales bacterium]